jgi:hypothetical protein
VSSGVAVTGPTGSISVVTPSIAGFSYSIYIASASTMANARLANTNSAFAPGPTSPYSGLATQLPPSTTVVVTNNTGAALQPPVAPASGVTVYPTFIIGRGAYGQVTLDDVKFTYLKEADKSDPLNQLRVVGWKCFYGTIILNSQFMARIESVSAFSQTFG